MKAEEKSSAQLAVCFQNRYNETTMKIDQMVEEGQIGEIKGCRAFVTWRRDEDYYIGSSWKGKVSMEGGGALINQSIYSIFYNCTVCAKF